MLCEKCGTRTVTTHVKTIVNGKLEEFSLCSQCAKDMGYGSLMNYFNLESVLGTLALNTKFQEDRIICPKCGATIDDIINTGKVGCENCYKVFASKLNPTIQRIHGTTTHRGKTPEKSALAVVKKNQEIAISKINPIEVKKLQLKNAIKEERFEDAIKLRDEIKEMS